MAPLNVDSLPEPGDRFELQDEIGVGIWAKVRINQKFIILRNE